MHDQHISNLFGIVPTCSLIIPCNLPSLIHFCIYLCKYCCCNRSLQPLFVSSLQSLIHASTSIDIAITTLTHLYKYLSLLPLQVPRLKSLLTRLCKYHHCKYHHCKYHPEITPYRLCKCLH